MSKLFESYSVSDLSSMVSQMPWFAAARVEICRRTCGDDPSQYEEAVPYVFSRGILSAIAHDTGRNGLEEADTSVKRLMGDEGKKKVRASGGDFFSQDEYDAVSETKLEYRPAFSGETELNIDEDRGEMDFCTEALAEIFSEQGYFSEALKIYSQLSLRYPEKSAYFATLIENTKKLERN